MKPTFIHSTINSPFDDPGIFVRILREKRAFLFDTGRYFKAEYRSPAKGNRCFHYTTHVDHFIGFDMLIRALLRRDLPVRVYGPSNIADCVEGKLKGYTWNLIKEYPLKIEVFSINRDTMFPFKLLCGE